MKKKKLAYQPLFFENSAWQNNTLVCGIDEAGRGPLAGPLVVGAVIIPVGKSHKLLQDSKVLTKTQRLKAYEWISRHCMYSYALCSNDTIDRINIYQATLVTMKKNFYQLIAKYNIISQLSHVLIDAMPLSLPTTYSKLNIKYFNYGENISPTIAAASIVAKVERDRIMKTFNTIFPQYGLAKHKGYGTKNHIIALQKHGASLIHRQSFLTKLIEVDKNERKIQKSLF